jgi:hypothetical protein
LFRRSANSVGDEALAAMSAYQRANAVIRRDTTDGGSHDPADSDEE